jgi:hypothetical protein
MQTAEPNLSSPAPAPASRAELRGGSPYRDLAADSRNLSLRLELRALACEFAPERKRLRTLSAAALQIAQCLSGFGAKNA